MQIHESVPSRSLPVGHLSAVLATSLLLIGLAGRCATAADFLRGDVNGDGAVTISDPGFLSHYLFLDGPVPSCLEAADADDSGEVGITDSMTIMAFLFFGENELCDPFPAAGADLTPDGLTCEAYGGGAPLDDPAARLELDDAIVDSEGNATITVRVSSSRAIQGLSGRIAVAGDIFGNTGRTRVQHFLRRGLSYLAARVEGERLLFGSLFSLTEVFQLPPGQDFGIFQVTVCIDRGTPAGRYPLVFETGELVDDDTGSAIQPALSGSVLEVPAGLEPDAGCASVEEEGPRPKCRGTFPAECPDPELSPTFLRGDANADGGVGVADAGFIEAYLAGNGPAPTCMKAADADDSGTVDLDDAAVILELSVEGGPDLCPPYHLAGNDPTPDALSCDAYMPVWQPVEPVDELRLADARVASDGTFTLTIHVTNSAPLAGYTGHVNMPEIFPNGAPNTARDLTGAGDPYVAAAVWDGHLTFGFLASRTGEAVLPPGVDRPVLEIRGCVTKGMHLGHYPFDLDGVLILGGTHKIILAKEVQGGLIVPDEMGEAGCEELHRPRQPGCVGASTGPDVPFRRGDANADGRLSISDVAMLRRFRLEDGRHPTCQDAADANDNGEIGFEDMTLILRYLFLGEGDIPPPHGDPGVDPTADGLSCLKYTVLPPVETEEVLRIGDAEAPPGSSVDIPVLLTNCRAVEAVQLLVQYDPAAFTPREVRFEGSHLSPPAHFASLRSGPIPGVFTLAIFPSFSDFYEVRPGRGQLIFSIRGDVSPEAPAGTQVLLLPTDGPDGGGLGPERLRNEITYQGHARYPSFLPKGAILHIVPDVAIFRRGDSNRDEALDLSDAQHTLSYLFLGGEKPPCLDAADTNDDGVVDMSDPISLLGFLFLGNNPLPDPHPEPGTDPSSDGLGCAEREG